MARESLEKWIRRVTSDPMLLEGAKGARRCVALVLVHCTVGSSGSEVYAYRLGNKDHDAKKVADLFNAMADEHSAGIAQTESGSGYEQYEVQAFYDDMPELPAARLPINRKTGPMIAPGEELVSSEPPNAQGVTRQDMRHRESWMAFTLEMNARMYANMSGIIDRLSTRLSTVERENQDAFTIAKEMILEKAADAHDQRMKELAFERSSEERARLMKMLPPLANKLTGREIFPQSTVDSSLIEALIESTDEAQMQKIVEALLPVLKPEQAALLINRFAEIQEAVNARKAKKAPATTANGNGAKS